MGKEIVNQVQEAQRAPHRLNSRRNTLRHTLIKLTEIKHKERILKAAREKQQVTYMVNRTRLTVDLSAEILQARREWQDKCKVLKEKTYNHDYYTWQRSHLNLKENSKALQTSRN